MGFSGRLEGIAPSDIFQIISQSRMTGTLIARCQEGTAMVVFKNGQVIEAASDAPQESLGHLLVTQGTVSERTIEAAKELRKQQPNRPLGAILVDMSAIDQKALETVVLKQIGQIVHRLISCDDGFITFDRGEVAVKRKLNTGEFYFPSGLSAEFLIMERARAVDEERRKGNDRRASSLQSGEPWDGVERRASAAKQQSAVGAVWRKLGTVLGSSATTLMGRATSAVHGLRQAYRVHAEPWISKALFRARTFSPDGKALLYAGSGAMALGVGLLVAALSSAGPDNMLLVTGRIVNLRAEPTTKSNVVAKASQGDTVAALSFSEGWHEVRTTEGNTGWVWKSLVEKQEGRSANGTGLTVLAVFVLVASLAFLSIGILRRRRTASARSGVPREV
jgi:hypothetical protein